MTITKTYHVVRYVRVTNIELEVDHPSENVFLRFKAINAYESVNDDEVPLTDPEQGDKTRQYALPLEDIGVFNRCLPGLRMMGIEPVDLTARVTAFEGGSPQEYDYVTNLAWFSCKVISSEEFDRLINQARDK